MIAGPLGNSSAVLCHLAATRDSCSDTRWQAAKTSLVSTRLRSIAPRKSGAIRAARKASAIKLPRPGPNSASRRGLGSPTARQTATHQRPINSPNIWLISGAVMKSPLSPNGILEA